MHPSTLVNAFHFAYRKTSRADTRALLLLQAAAWMPMCREVLREVKDLSLDAPGFERLDPPREKVGVEQALQEADRDYVAAAAFEEFRLADPRFGPHLLAPCLSYLPTPATDDSDVHRRASAALRRLKG